MSRDEKEEISKWVTIKRGFLQGDSFSPVEFCLAEMIVEILLSNTEGYRMGSSRRRNIKRTHSLFIDDLKIYQPSYKKN